MRKIQPDIMEALSRDLVGFDMAQHLAEMPMKKRIESLTALSESAVSQATREDYRGGPWGHQDASIASAVGTAIMLARSMFLESGKNVYSMGPKARSTFASLKLGKLGPKDVLLPFKCIYLDIGSDSGMYIWGGPRTEWHEVEGAYVYTIGEGLIRASPTVSSDSPPCLGVILWGPANDKSIDGTDDAVFNIMLRTDTLTSGVDAEKHFKGILQGTSFVQAGNAAHKDPGVKERAGLSNNSVPTLVKAARLVLNAVLYITSASPEVSPDPRTLEKTALEARLTRAGCSKKKRLERKLEKHSSCYIRQLAPGLERGPVIAGSVGPGVARHHVCAHWHRYWVKEGHPLWDRGQLEDAKGKRLVRIYVAEHYRGNDMAGRVSSRTYKLEEPI